MSLGELADARHQLAAPGRGHHAPALVRDRRRGHDGLVVLRGGAGHAGGDGAVGGIDRGEDLAVLRRAPAAAARAGAAVHRLDLELRKYLLGIEHGRRSQDLERKPPMVSSVWNTGFS